MKKLFLFSISIILFCQFSYCQEFKPLFKIEGFQLNKGWASIPYHNFKINNISEVYINDKVMFKPEGDFRYCIFEMFKNQFLIITAIDEEQKDSELIYTNLKKKIKIIDLQTNKVYDFDLKNMKLVNVELLDNQLEISSIECKLHKQKL
ncbi:MAG: hypothetical protein V4548_06700 [Bacteroidota bacterium]